MLVYRVLEKDKSYNNEIDAYQKGVISPNGPTRMRDESINTFDYHNAPYRLHFFVFSEDAQTYLKMLIREEGYVVVPDGVYAIGEYEVDDKVATIYSGFGCYSTFFKVPTLELAVNNHLKLRIPYKKGLSLSKREKLSDEERLLLMKEEKYYLLEGIRPTNRLFFEEDISIEDTYREILYKKYCAKLYKEFLEAYKVCYDKSKEMFDNSKSPIEDDELLNSRANVLRKYDLIK